MRLCHCFIFSVCLGRPPRKPEPCTSVQTPAPAVTAGKELVMADGGSEAGALSLGTGNYELSVPGAAGGRKVLGSREFALYYKQRHRAVDTRQSVTVNAMVAR